MLKIALRPAITLDQIFGDGHWFSPQQPKSQCIWMPNVRDATTAVVLTYAGTMPVLCSENVARPEALNFLRDAGVPLAENIEVFSDEEDYLGKLARIPGKVVTNYVHDEGELPAEKSWIPQGLLADLNDKASLVPLVPRDFRVRRRVVASADLRTLRTKAPVVLKVSAATASGSGSGVRICKTRLEVDAALQAFAGYDVVVEKFLQLRRTWNLQYAVTHKSEILYLGASEQIGSPEGVYEGNWLEADLAPSTEAIEAGMTIMARGAAAGFRGVAGFDFGELFDGRMIALDLNFRLNGSTAAVLLAKDLFSQMAPVMLNRTWLTKLPFAQVFSIAQGMMEENGLVPVSFYRDPLEGVSKMRFLLLGATRHEVKEREQALTARLAA